MLPCPITARLLGRACYILYGLSLLLLGLDGPIPVIPLTLGPAFLGLVLGVEERFGLSGMLPVLGTGRAGGFFPIRSGRGSGRGGVCGRSARFT